MLALYKGEEKFVGYKDGEEITVRVELDDIDHFGNRRIRAVGELIRDDSCRFGSHGTSSSYDRMTTQDVDSITAQPLINTRPVTAAY